MPSVPTTHTKHPTLQHMPTSLAIQPEQEACSLSRRLRLTRQTSQGLHHPLLALWQTIRHQRPLASRPRNARRPQQRTTRSAPIMQRLTRKRQAMTICANPRCAQEFPDKVHAGQQKKYCNRQCKNKHWEPREHSETRKQYLQSDKRKASNKKRTAKYLQSQRGIHVYQSRLELYKLLNKRDSLNRKASRKKVCKVCRSLFDGFNARLVFCSEICEWLDGLTIRKVKPCEECGLMGLWKQKFCNAKCQKISYNRSDNYVRHRRIGASRGHIKRRIRLASQFIEEVDRFVMAQRDNWICHICLGQIDQTLKYPNRYALSVDHVIPLSKGGSHGYDNCKSSHWICNVLKSDKVDIA